MFLPCVNKVYVYIVCMLFPLTNFSSRIWSLTGWAREFKTCLGGVEWLWSYMTDEEFEPKSQVVQAERLDTWLFQTLEKKRFHTLKTQCIPCGSTWHFRLKFHIPPRQVQVCTYIHTYKFQNPHPIKARFKFSTFRRPFVSNSLVSRHGRVKYPWVVRAG